MDEQDLYIFEIMLFHSLIFVHPSSTDDGVFAFLNAVCFFTTQNLAALVVQVNKALFLLVAFTRDETSFCFSILVDTYIRYLDTASWSTCLDSGPAIRTRLIIILFLLR